MFLLAIILSRSLRLQANSGIYAIWETSCSIKYLALTYELERITYEKIGLGKHMTELYLLAITTYILCQVYIIRLAEAMAILDY